MLPGDVALESQLFCQSSKLDLEEKENHRFTRKILGSKFAKFSRVYSSGLSAKSRKLKLYFTMVPIMQCCNIT